MAAHNQNDAHAVPGEDLTLTSSTLNVGQAALQGFAPLKKVCQHVCAFHFYAHDMKRQVEAHHYCSHLNEEVRQCVIYDSDAPTARLIGVEYMISRRLFEDLPAEEKKYWHSHRYEVMSGMLVAPGVPAPVESLEMQKVVDTYGKVFHFWQVDRGDPLPFGPPQLMMAFTGDGQLDPGAVADRDRRYKKDSAELRTLREKTLTAPASIAPGADHWEQDPDGHAWQITMEKVPFKK